MVIGVPRGPEHGPIAATAPVLTKHGLNPAVGGGVSGGRVGGLTPGGNGIVGGGAPACASLPYTIAKPREPDCGLCDQVPRSESSTV
jgi:hypothetical protein